MSGFPDQDFERPPIEPMQLVYATPPPDSGLAVASLILSIAGLIVLPVFGPIAGIITGHMALGKIKQSKGTLGGRTMALIGMILGYIQVVLTIISTIVVVLIFVIFARHFINNPPGPPRTTIEIKTETSDIATPSIAPPSILPSPGIKWAAEMTPADFKAIDDAKIEVKKDDIVAFFYKVEPQRYDDKPELTLLTKSQLICVKDGLTNAFALREIASILDDADYSRKYSKFDPSSYQMELTTKGGATFRWRLFPKNDAIPFFDALKSATTEASQKP